MEGLHRYAYMILRSNDEASDAVQTVFLKLWEKRFTIDEQQSVRSWLYTAVHNYCLNSIRNAGVRRSYLQHRREPISSGEDPVVSKEMLELIRVAIESLPPQCKLIFQKSRFEKKKYAEIAAELDLSVKTVEAQVGKALKVLREKLSWALVLFTVPLLL